MKQRKMERASRAAERLAITSKLSPEERIANLDSRLGKGIGALKERQRLAGKIVRDDPILPKVAIKKEKNKKPKKETK
jgi:hypothetical protein